MPEVLELKPLKEKHLKLIMIESEFPIDWWFEVPVEKKEDLIWNLHLISKEYLELIESFVEKYKPDIALEERPNFWVVPSNSEADPLKTLFEQKNIPFNYGDISENAEYYLSASLDEHRIMIKSLETRIQETIQKNGEIPEQDEFFQRLVMWKEYLQNDYDSEEDQIRYAVREAWMLMKIINLAKTIEGKKLKGLFICDLRHFNGLEKLALDLGIETEQFKIKRAIRTEEIEEIFEDEIKISK